MAEQFKKIYITVREFITSWEKEVYELNNLDYFIYILINQLGTYIRKEYFARNNNKDELYLSDDEIAALVFNIGDTLQYFMEKNCFNVCPFNCPAHLNDKINPNEKYLREIFPDEEIISNPSCKTKEDCFYMEVLNNVVLESLIDFYNYDKGIVFEISDLKFFKFASIIVDQIVDSVSGAGSELLKNPFENKSDRFEELLANTEDSWDAQYMEMEDEEEESELWKVGHVLIDNVIEEYRFGHPATKDNHLRVLDKFREYLIDFLGLQKITEINEGDIREFMAIHFFHDMVIEQQSNISGFLTEFRSFFKHIDYHFNLTLMDKFDSLMHKEQANIERILQACYEYFSENSFVEFMLSDEYTNESINEGFFEIISSDKDKYTIKDIHLETEIENVSFNPLSDRLLRNGDILHVQLIEENKKWRLATLEMIYPEFAKVYLI